VQDKSLYFDVIFIYKILHDTIKDSFLLSNINLSVPTFTSRNRQTFHISIHKTLYGFFSPINRTLVSCNNLQNKLDIFHSPQKRSKLIYFLFNHFFLFKYIVYYLIQPECKSIYLILLYLMLTLIYAYFLSNL